ncbi:protein PFC0760c-like isoform X2 [Daktulosphaira vitifoliae]|uniref:protein PFC0760c-like isoform X2 n=1 Tax=Daktulosphaira vitifoliae TaxID=58002 RepID=UPI0021AA3893|nr:protein PFC0760c-like isoform X2 [Daktulosphaira vitifoliae]
MRFYFSFGILLCFIFLITIPKFSFGLPCSDEETNINDIDPISSEVNNNDPIQDKYPISTYFSNIMSGYLWKLVNDDENGYEDDMNKFYDDVRDSKKYNKKLRTILLRLITNMNNDNKKELIKEYISYILKHMQNDEADLKKKLRQISIKSNGTVKIDYVKRIMENPLFKDRSNYKIICELVIKKNVEDLLANLINIEDNEDDEDDEEDEDDADDEDDEHDVNISTQYFRNIFKN